MVSCGEVRPQIHPQMVQCSAMRHQSPSAMARYDAKCILQWSIAVQFGAVRHTHANAFSLILTEFNRCPFSMFFTMFFFSPIRDTRVEATQQLWHIQSWGLPAVACFKEPLVPHGESSFGFYAQSGISLVMVFPPSPHKFQNPIGFKGPLKNLYRTVKGSYEKTSEALPRHSNTLKVLQIAFKTLSKVFWRPLEVFQGLQSAFSMHSESLFESSWQPFNGRFEGLLRYFEGVLKRPKRSIQRPLKAYLWAPCRGLLSLLFTKLFFSFYPEYESGGTPTAMARTIFTHDNRKALISLESIGVLMVKLSFFSDFKVFSYVSFELGLIRPLRAV